MKLFLLPPFPLLLPPLIPPPLPPFSFLGNIESNSKEEETTKYWAGRKVPSRFFCKVLWENLKELLGQPNTLVLGLGY